MAGGWTSGCNLAVRSPRSQRQGGCPPTGHPLVCLRAGVYSREGRGGWPRGLAPRHCRPTTFFLRPHLGPVPLLGPCSQSSKAFSSYLTWAFALPPPSPQKMSAFQSGL